MALILLKKLFLKNVTCKNFTFNSLRMFSEIDRPECDILIVGGGIVGAATAREILKRNKNLQVKIVEKENELGVHQTNHNSGVIHAGIYYIPGSLKAKLCGQGLRLTYEYCDKKKIPYKKIGKLIVATTPIEVERLSVLIDRAKKNKVPDMQVIEGKEIQAIEPFCRGLKAIWSPHTGIVDFRQMCFSYADDFKKCGGVIYLNFEVVSFCKSSDPEYPVLVKAKSGQYIKAKHVFTCGGLYSDKLAVMSNCSRNPQIIPFRGEYLILHESKNHMVSRNIYPVPDPMFPFLGVHFTPRMDGRVLLGPNAVLGFAREGYTWTDINIKEFWETISFVGFRKMAFKFLAPGSKEMLKSVMPSLQMKDLQRYIPEITADHVSRGPAGVRAQAMMDTGALVDDFVFSKGEGPIGERVLHCRNAPSPACTSSLAIAKYLVDKIKTEFRINV